MNKLIVFISVCLATLNMQAQNVLIPDANFKAALVGNVAINTNNDTEIQVSEAISFTGTINVPGKSISSLVGIELFSKLTGLNCYSNKLTAVDLTKNTFLTSLNCRDNLLKTIDITNNVVLNLFSCDNNQINTLDVSKNTTLTYLYCSHNPLVKLDITKNVTLTLLECNSSQLLNLDVSKNTVLKSLECDSNQISILDVSKNTVLTLLSCIGNQLKTLDVSMNSVLVNLYCNSNQLNTLDLSKNSTLTTLSCISNQLSTLDVSKNIALTKALHCTNNPSLSQICINNEQLGRINTIFWTKDPSAIWSTTCVTGIEDELLEPVTKKIIIRILSPLGQEIKPEQALHGMYIYEYSDGSVRKVMKQ